MQMYDKEDYRWYQSMVQNLELKKYIFKVFMYPVEFQGLFHWKPRTLAQCSHLQSCMNSGLNIIIMFTNLRNLPSHISNCSCKEILLLIDDQWYICYDNRFFPMYEPMENVPLKSCHVAVNLLILNYGLCTHNHN